MNKLQKARHQANVRGSLFLVAHDAELILIVLYASLKVSFNSNMAKIYAAMQKQYDQTGYITFDKKLLREMVENCVLKYALIGSAQAFVTNHPELAFALNIMPNYLTKASEADLVGRSNEIVKIITDNSAILTEITPANILEMENAISDFSDLKDIPKSEIKLKKTIGTDPIPGLLNDQDVIKEYIGKLIFAYLPSLYPTWMGEIKVGTPTGVRLTSWILKCTDSETGVPLRNVKITINNGVDTITKKSTVKGFVRFYSLTSDNYSLVAEHDSFVNQQKHGIGIDDQHIEKTNIKLQKVTSTGILNLTVFDKVTSKPIPGVELSIPALGYTQSIGDDGKVSVGNISAGDYQASISCEGFIELNFSFSIQVLKTTSLELFLETEG